MPGTLPRPSDWSIRRLTRKLVNRAKTVETRATPSTISTIPKTTNQADCPEKLRSP
jgi:hypothetical protein